MSDSYLRAPSFDQAIAPTPTGMVLLSDVSEEDPGSIVSKDGSEGERPRTFLDSSTGGPADRLADKVARGHGIVAISIATTASFAVAGLFMAASGFLITHVLEHGSITVWDHHVSQWFDNHRSSHWNGIAGELTDKADTFAVSGVAAIVTIVLLIRRWGRHGFLLVASFAIELSVLLTTNRIVARPRLAVSHLRGTASTYNSPSGHTAATVVLCGGIPVIVMVATTRWWACVVMWTLAVVMTMAVDLSRVYRGESKIRLREAAP